MFSPVPHFSYVLCARSVSSQYLELFHAVVNLDSSLLDLGEEQVCGNIALLQDPPALADGSRGKHLDYDRGWKSGGAHHGAHIRLGVVIVHHRERSHPALQASAQ